MAAPTSSTTEHVFKFKTLNSGSTDHTTSGETTKEVTDGTTLPDHDNMHAGTVDLGTTPERRTTPTDGKELNNFNMSKILKSNW